MSTYNTNDIAIIGTSLRFPEASNHLEFWDMLINNKSGISYLSDDEMRDLKIPEVKRRKSGFVNAGSIVKDPYLWDANFFGFSPKVAAITDPQQRLLLETAWELIETSGYSPLTISCPTGVYISVASNNYINKFRENANQSDDYIAFTSNDPDFASSRISYHLNLKGPSLTIETACSSSLVAVHMACESLLNGEVDMAVCGGASILFPQAGYIYDPNLIFSPDGKCRPFDKAAKGTVFGNGVGLVLLKRLDDAIESKDTIWGVIKGSAVNNDGIDKNSYYSPSPQGQKEVIKEALAVAQLLPENIGYIEAHGTATPIGDPIEFEALQDVFQDSTSKKNFCYLGSVKSNLGHLNKAAGIAGLIKAVLSLKHKAIPATLNFSGNNPEIDLSNSPFIINPEPISWDQNNLPRRAGVSSFGVGGTNAHVVLEEAPIVKGLHQSENQHFALPISAKSPEYLEVFKKDLVAFLSNSPEIQIEDLAFTLQQSRSQYSYREGIVSNSVNEFIEWLSKSDAKPDNPNHKQQNDKLADWKSGKTTSWSSIENGIRIWLPSHPMIKSLHQISDYMPQEEVEKQRLLPLVEENLSGFAKQLFKTNFRRDEYLLQEHNHILPAAAYIEILAECMKLSGDSLWNYSLKDLLWKQAFTLKEKDKRSIYIGLHSSKNNNQVSFYFSADEDNDQNSIAHGVLFPSDPSEQSLNLDLYDLENLKTYPSISSVDIYRNFNKSGFRYGEHFQLIKEIFRSEDKALATISLEYISPDKDQFTLDPLLIDAAFQTAVSLLPSFDASLELYVPYQVKEVSFYKKPEKSAIVVAHRLNVEQGAVERFNVFVLNQDQSVCIKFLNVELVKWNRSNQEKPKSTATKERIKDFQPLEGISSLLQKVIAEELGYAQNNLNIEETFESLGLDSVLLVNIINQLDTYFGDLPKTLFFEYPTITEAANYLYENYSEICLSLTDSKATVQETIPSAILSEYQKPTVNVMESFENQHMQHQNRENDIAIIGVHGRYPESGNLEAFWENLKKGTDCIKEIPEERWCMDGFYDPDVNKTDTSFTKWGGFLDKIEYFDPIFFKISPKEAAFIDPQERLFLESAWGCVENAGYTPKNICGEERKVGVYAGVMWGHYQLYAIEEYQRGEIVVNTSNYWSIPNRVSYTMNFNGPSLAVDTACSSSLSAIHLACQSILTGESDLAIAGGVNLNLHPYKHYILSARRFAATDGRCRSFGEGGSGYVPGEGVGTVLLKPLNKAISDGDYIHGVIKGSAINHGGKAGGFTVPNSNAQASVVKRAFDQAGIAASDISYIEAHGTGTSLGDPIEVNGLVRAYADKSGNKQYCPIGSVKSNIGHLESAAGIASIQKVLLQLKHKKLVPSIHNEPLNPYIDFQNSPFKVQKKLEEWHPSNTYSKRLAGISSFGAGGANAHIVVEEAPEITIPISKSGKQIIVLSAQDENTLKVYANDLLKHIENPEIVKLSISSIAYTLQSGRTPFDHRLAFTATEIFEIKDKLTSFLDGKQHMVSVGKVDKTSALPAREIVSNLIANNNHEELAATWAQGAVIDWSLIWNYNPGRTPLPSYPFSRRRLWYKDLSEGEPMAKILSENAQTLSMPKSTVLADTKTESISNAVSSSIKPEISKTDIVVNYFNMDILPVPLNSTKENSENPLILFTQMQEEYLYFNERYPNNVIWVKPGINFERDPFGFKIPLSDPKAYATLYNALTNRLGTSDIDILINVSSVFEADIDLITNFFRHTKCLAETFKKPKFNLLAFWNSKSGNEAAYRALGSFAKVASKESNRLNIRVVEFRDINSVADYSSKLIRELNSQHQKREALYIGQKRFEYAIQRLNPESSTKAGISIKSDGVYLITGGLGAIGQTMATWLESQGAKAVILTGRKAISQLNEDHKEFLRKYQGRIAYIPSDLTNQSSIQNLIASINSSFRKLNGIFHSAGIVNDKLLLKKTEESFESVITPKIKGALNLDAACSEYAPDFIVYFSSVSAVAGQIGQIDYSTANRYLDEYAAYKNTVSSTIYKSINWPYWNNGGMVLAQPYVDMMRKNGMDGITNQEGMLAIEHVLNSQACQTIVFKGNEKGCTGFFTDTHLNLIEQNQKENNYSTDFQKEARKIAPIEKQSANSGLPNEREIKGKIVAILSETLGLSSAEIDTGLDLEEYGVDSVAIMKVTAELEKLFPELSISLFFECKSIDDITGKITEELQSGMLSYSGSISAEEKKTIQVPQPINSSNFKTELNEKIVGILSEVLSLAPAEIDSSTELEEYGVDSVAIMKITAELEKLFPDLSISLFFECKSVDNIVNKLDEEVQSGTLSYRGKTNYKRKSIASESIPAAIHNPENNYKVIQNRVVGILSDVLGLSSDEIETSMDLEEYGVDSVAIMKVTAELEKLYSGLSISLFFECKSIDDIATRITEELADGNLTSNLSEQSVEHTSTNFLVEDSAMLKNNFNQSSENTTNPANLSAELKELIVSILGETLGLTSEEIDTSSDLEEYGVDSVAIMKITAELEKTFPELSISLFFECKSVDDIVSKIDEVIKAGVLTYSQNIISISQADSLPRISPAKEYFRIEGTKENQDRLSYSITLDASTEEVKQHVIDNKVIFAGAGYLDLVKKIADNTLGIKVNIIKNISWFSPLIIQENTVPIEVDLVPKGKARQYSFSSSGKALAKGEISHTPLSGKNSTPPSELIRSTSSTISGNEVYDWFNKSNFQYGPAFQTIETLYIGSEQVIGKLRKPVNQQTWLSPMVLDGIFQCIAGFTVNLAEQSNVLWVPFFIAELTVFSEKVPDQIWVRVDKKISTKDSGIKQFNIELIDAAGNIYLQITNFTLKSFGEKKSPEKPKETQAINLANSFERNAAEPIAIISSACKFPGADSPDKFWKNIRNEIDVVKEVPAERWDYRQSFNSQKGTVGKTYSKWGGFINNVDAFDNTFFKIKDNDALSLDPQQRILLELTQHLFDSAGYSRSEITNSNTAIIIGAASGMWNDIILDLPFEYKRNVVVNTIQNMIAARISDFYDLKGPSLTIDTACSSSLVAVHEACQKIRLGECNMAIVGGITLLLHGGGHVGFSQAQVLSPNGKCHVFDKNADGIVLGEGAGLVLLKSYKQAVKDGDKIQAVIRGSAVNNDGKTMGITTPNMLMQREVIRTAIKNSGVDQNSISYLEAHGTGTLLGDPIEVKAAREVYGEGTNKKQYCGISSVKSNIGHLLHASGIASLIKVAKALQNKELPASLNCTEPHPRFEFANSPFYPVTKTKKWETEGKPRRAGVSSFGFGGTNCHLIAEEVDASYTPTRVSLPLTVFNRKRFWPGKPMEAIKSNGQIQATNTIEKAQPRVENGISDIINKLESGSITIEQALELEKTL